jgi:RNA polymerase sigma factor (TIGR02999 family)
MCMTDTSSPGTDPPKLGELVYRQLKTIAHVRMTGERPGHLLHTTALVHEALMKLTQDGQIRLEDRPGFFRAAAAAMRQILIDHARAARRIKRGGARAEGGSGRVELDLADLQAKISFDPDQILTIDEAMTRLAANEPAAAELVRLRFFAGLTMEEAADAAGVSVRTAERLWSYARAWLWRELSPDDA